MSDVFQPTEAPVIAADSLVGEGKKFKTVEDLAKGKVEADAFIEKLKTELKEIRTMAEGKLNAETALQELRDEIKTLREGRVERPKDNTSPELTPTDVQTLVEQTITSRESQKTAEQNILEANSKMVEVFGTTQAAQAHLQARAKELNVGTSWLKDMAAKSPQGFLDLMNVGKAKDGASGSFVQGSVNPDALRALPNGQAPKEGSRAYFDKLRKEKPAEWMSAAVQLQMHKAAKEGKYF